jgi:NAD(P)-dependent dehydrogenase (short-subunit alcohol dehydrogenase family)
MTVLICGANGSIGSVIAQEESKTHKVVGTYRNYDDHAKELETNPNITLVQKDVSQSSDMKDVVDLAREQGTINKVYWLIGESWNVSWHNVTIEDIRKAIQICAEPVASLILELKPELMDENNFMRWASVSGLSATIFPGGKNKVSTGGAKHLAEFYFRSAAGYYGWRKNLFNNVRLGYSNRTKNLHVGITGDALKKIYDSEIPVSRATGPETPAGLMLWLCSDKNTYMTGQDIVLDGGESIRTRENSKKQDLFQFGGKHS